MGVAVRQPPVLWFDECRSSRFLNEAALESIPPLFGQRGVGGGDNHGQRFESSDRCRRGDPGNQEIPQELLVLLRVWQIAQELLLLRRMVVVR